MQESNRLNYNALLINGYNSYQNKDYQKALMYYKQAEHLSTDTISSPLVKSIMGVLHMHNCNYTEAISCFDSGLRQIKTSQFSKSQSLDADYEVAAVTIKLQSNLSLCYMILGQYRQAVQQVDNCLQILKQSSDKNVKGLYESLVYIFYRFHNFAMMRNADFDSLETKYDDYSQACFYSTMAINKELCDSPEQAYALQKKALDIWTSKKEIGFMLVTAQHLLALARESNMGKKTISEYEKLVASLLSSEQLEGVSEKTLFKGFNEKMKCAKTITSMLLQFQKDELKYRGTQEMELKDWKFATKLKLQRAIRQAQGNMKTSDSKTRKDLQLAVEQMKQTLLSLETQSNTLIERNLQRSKFVIDATNSFNGLKRLADRVSNIFNLHARQDKKTSLYALMNQREPTFTGHNLQGGNSTPRSNKATISAFTQQSPKPSFQKQAGYQSQIPKPSDIRNQSGQYKPEPPVYQIQNIKQTSSKMNSAVGSKPLSKFPNSNTSQVGSLGEEDDLTRRKLRKLVQICQKGQYFQKRNYSSDGGEIKYVMITRTQLRWTTDENKVDKKGQYQFYALKDIRGIIYGKQTDTFRKSCNRKYLPWRCFSLVLQKRTFDLCAQNDLDISIWVPGLSQAIKKAHPQTKDIRGYTPGRLLWKRMWIRLTHYFIQPLKKSEKRTYFFQRAQALRRFKQNDYNVPKTK